ncbi:MAG: nucleotidyltransferase family protein [Acetobacteraceae bacterium]
MDKTLGQVPSQDDAQRQRFEAILRADADLMLLLRRLRDLRLSQWRLVAGCLYQTVWNVLTGRPGGTGIQDYDVIYFDDRDLSWEAEDAVIRQVAAATSDCVGPVQVRNQARVHLWFPDRFGVAYPRLSCADDALRHYASVSHAIGVRLEADDRFDVTAPFGFEDVFAMVIRPNRVLPNAQSHTAKASRAKAIWPEVTVVPWDDGEQA